MALAAFHRRVGEETYCVADALGVCDALGRAGQMEHQMATGTRFTASDAPGVLLVNPDLIDSSRWIGTLIEIFHRVKPV